METITGCTYIVSIELLLYIGRVAAFISIVNLISRKACSVSSNFIFFFELVSSLSIVKG